MNKVELIKAIMKTAMCTLPVVFGFIFCIVSKEACENFFGRLVSIRDLELSTVNFVVFKMIGVVMLLGGLGLAFYFFIYDPSAAARAASESY